MKLLKHLVLSALLGGLFFVSCKDDKDESLQAPVISSVSPQEALPGSLISISGENFPASVEGLQLSIGETYIVAKSCTPNKVEFELPQLKAGAYKLKLSTGPDLTATASIQVKALEMGEISFSPLKAKAGDLLIISGSNFGLNPKSVKLYIGGILQEIKSIKNTEIRLNLSPDVKSGKLKLIKTDINGEHVKEAGEEFTLLYPEMVLSGFSPEKGKAGAEITLSGEHFGTDKDALKVIVNGKEQEITSITNTEVKITLAAKTFAGKLELERTNADGTKQKLEADKEMDYEVTYRTEVFLDKTAVAVSVDNNGDLYFTERRGAIMKVAKNTTNAVVIKEDPGNVLYTDILRHSNGKLYVSEGFRGEIYEIENGNAMVKLPLTGASVHIVYNIIEGADGQIYHSGVNDDKVWRYNPVVGKREEIVDGLDDAYLPFFNYENKLCVLTHDFKASNSRKIYEVVGNGNYTLLKNYSDIIQGDEENNWAEAIDHPILGKLVLIGHKGIASIDKNYEIAILDIPGIDNSKLFDICLTPEMDLVTSGFKDGSKIMKIIIE